MTWGQRPRKQRTPPPLAGGGGASESSRRGRTTFKRARELRTNSTDAEAKLWRALRRKHICGLRFRRQFTLGPYFVDFVCLKARLVVEVDGSQHFEADQMAHDERRTAWLARNDFRVLRFTNHDVLSNLDGVVRVIEGITEDRATARGVLPRR